MNNKKKDSIKSAYNAVRTHRNYRKRDKSRCYLQCQQENMSSYVTAKERVALKKEDTDVKPHRLADKRVGRLNATNR